MSALKVSYLRLVGKDPRADLAELRSQVRYLADEYERPNELALVERAHVAHQLRQLVGPWPHETTKEKKPQ